MSWATGPFQIKQVAEGEPASVGGHMSQGLRVDAWPCTPRCVPAPQSAPNTTGRLRGCWMKAGVTISARRGPFRTNGSLLWPQGLIATVSHRCALDGCSELPDRCLREGHQREPGMGARSGGGRLLKCSGIWSGLALVCPK